MSKRYAAIWFRHLTTDWTIRKNPELKGVPFVLAAPERGRMVVKAVSVKAQTHGISTGMVVADCRAVLPQLQVFDEQPVLAQKLLRALAEWCIRFTPIAAIDGDDGLLLDISGCAHLWGGEQVYLKDILQKLRAFGYHVRAAVADTIGTAWAVSRFGQVKAIIESGGQMEALQPLPPAALRLDRSILERMDKLGLYLIRSFIGMPRSALRRRFGTTLLQRIDQALGQEIELLQPVFPIEAYRERLPCLEPIRTATGIEIALCQLLQTLCERLSKEEKGLRKAVFKGYRIDGIEQQIEIGTNRPSRNVEHLFKLFELKIVMLEPDLGFELFTLEATIVEDYPASIEYLWQLGKEEHDKDITELMDRIAGKLGVHTLHRYLPAEHYWPEHSFKEAASIQEQAQTAWRTDRQRPVHLLPQPEEIEVMVRLPDYPPAHFNYKGKVYRIQKADGPERIEREWWLQDGEYRDYYCVEDEDGARYWLFRLGSYETKNAKWFLHGFFS
jgi:protein ImuB